MHAPTVAGTHARSAPICLSTRDRPGPCASENCSQFVSCSQIVAHRMASAEAAAARAELEATLGQGLVHPHIVRTYRYATQPCAEQVGGCSCGVPRSITDGRPQVQASSYLSL